MILCVGTTPAVQRTMFFDRLALDQVNRATEVVEHASGKSINVARVLRALAEPALALGFAGGRRGQFLLGELTREGIGHEFVIIDRETRLCTTLIDRATAAVTELVEEAPAASTGQWAQFTQLVEESLEDTDVLVFSGTLAGGAADDFVVRWIGRGPRVIVDVSGPPLRHALEKPGCIAKVNRHELSRSLDLDLPDQAAIVDAIRRFTPAQGRLLVTMGSDGLIGGDGQSIWRARGPAIRALNPIGSGDAVAAGVAAALVRDLSFPDLLRLATAAGTANALTGLSGVVRAQDIQDIEPRITVDQLS